MTEPKGKHERSPLRDKTEVNKQRILDYFKRIHAEHGLPPTYEQIALEIGWKNISGGTVYPLVEDLIAKGFLKRAAKGARVLVLADPQPAEYYYRQEDHLNDHRVKPQRSTPQNPRRAHNPEFKRNL